MKENKDILETTEEATIETPEVEVEDADAMYDFLIARGIIVRNRNRVRGCEGCLRITIGLPEENERLLESIAEYEKSVVR